MDPMPSTTESPVSSGGDAIVPDEGGEMDPSTTESPVSGGGGEEGINPADENESPTITSAGYRMHLGLVIGCFILCAFQTAT